MCYEVYISLEVYVKGRWVATRLKLLRQFQVNLLSSHVKNPVKNEPNPVVMSKSITSLTRLANRQQITIYLIEQQLKARRFFDDIERIGLGPYDFEPNLDHLILKNVGLDDGKDETYSLYAKLIDKYSQQLKPEFRAIHKQAKKMYNELVASKKQLRRTSK